MASKRRPNKKNQSAFKKNNAKGGLSRQIHRFIPQPSQPAEALWRYLPLWLVTAFILRAIVALSGDFVIHPDEIMQYLEPAHRLVFGNGVSYWEYYYGGRSWLIPSLVAAVLYACKVVGLDSPVYYIAATKLLFCLLSLLVPLAMYILGRRLFSETTGRVALILGVFWYELVGFAHKPMTEFIATSLLLFLAMYALRAQSLTARQSFIAGFGGVLIAAVRFHYIPIIGVILLVPFLKDRLKNRGLMILGSCAALAAVGVFEYFTWGNFFHSYIVNFKVNLVINPNRVGESNWMDYTVRLLIGSGGLFLAACMAITASRHRLFLVALIAAVLIPHMLPAHQEYRFIYALIPFWLLLFADFLAVAMAKKDYQLRLIIITFLAVLLTLHTVQEHQESGFIFALLVLWLTLLVDMLITNPRTRKQSAPPPSSRWRCLVGVSYAFLVSGIGIANALPSQGWIYKAHSAETGYVHFLRDQDETFSIYHQLAEDESVKGLQDITRAYFNSGGYYYLHKRIPFYSANTISYPPAKTTEYVSHIIAFPMETPAGVSRPAAAGGRSIMNTEGGRPYPLPAYISDQTLGKLVFWDEQGQPHVVEGFSLAQEYTDHTVWKADEVKPLKQWENYGIFPDNEIMYTYMKQAFPDLEKKPRKVIQFSEDSTPSLSR